MIIKKFASLLKNTGECTFYGLGANRAALSCGHAIYLLPDVAQPQTDEQLRVMLDVPTDKWLGVHSEIKANAQIDAVGSANLLPITEDDETLEPLPFAVYEPFCPFNRVLISQSGRLVFFDEAYLAPIADAMKNNDFISYYARKMGSGGAYIIVQNGMDDVLAAIMPVQVEMQSFCEKIARFESLCAEELARRKITAARDVDLEEK